MNEAPPRRRMLRSIGAVLAGFITIVILSTATDWGLHGARVFPPEGKGMADSLWLLATAYRMVYGIAGCYIAALLAPTRPMRHALALGLVGVAVSVLGFVLVYGRGTAFGPLWYPLGLIATALPCGWVGGTLHGMRTNHAPWSFHE